MNRSPPTPAGQPTQRPPDTNDAEPQPPQPPRPDNPATATNPPATATNNDGEESETSKKGEQHAKARPATKNHGAPPSLFVRGCPVVLSSCAKVAFRACCLRFFVLRLAPVGFGGGWIRVGVGLRRILFCFPWWTLSRPRGAFACADVLRSISILRGATASTRPGGAFLGQRGAIFGVVLGAVGR